MLLASYKFRGGGVRLQDLQQVALKVKVMNLHLILTEIHLTETINGN